MNPFTPAPVEELVTINQKLAASLEWQSIPKCHLEVFATFFTLRNVPLELWSRMQTCHQKRRLTTWEATQKETCRRSRTTSDSDNGHPVVALQDVWTELERHLGNSRHHKCSRATTLTHIEQGDNNKLPRFADMCAGLPSRPWVLKLSFRDWPHR